jgi:signal transduction histidine kinase
VAKQSKLAGLLSPLARWVTSSRLYPSEGLFKDRSLSLRWYLVLLVAGTLLPVVLFAVVVVYKLSNQEQAAAERRMLLAARNLASNVDYELSSTIRTLDALAVSQQLYAGDLEGFHQEANRLVEKQPAWLTVILLSPEGQQVMNSQRPLGTPLPLVNEPNSLRRLVATEQPVVGDLAPGSLTQTLAFPVRVPIIQDGELKYGLTAVISPEALTDVVVEEQAPVEGEWTRTIVDGQGIVVARTRDPERFVGQRGTPSFLKSISETNEGIFRNTTLDGVKVYVAFSRIRGTPWTAAITVPVEVIQSPVRQAMELVIVSGVLLLLVSGLGAFILSRQISRSITSAAAAAAALVNDEYPQVNPLSIREVMLLGQSLEFAADLLSQRERARTENLRQAEAAREEAEAANRTKDEFLAVLSHELRTPLNPILGWSNLLRNGRLDAEKTAFALETIERNARLQTQLIEDLLDVTRIMQGKLALKMTPVNLVSIIEAAIETVRLAAETKAIQVQTDLDSAIGPVLGDATRLQQVVWNLLSNAVKFTAKGGQITIRLSQIGSHAQIEVIDSGKGIHPNFLPHVFEYFRQEDGTTTRKFGGLGLGLAIVKHLVELHGGTVQADSPGEGQGATFTVRLPLL